jgi:hypothetical protein
MEKTCGNPYFFTVPPPHGFYANQQESHLYLPTAFAMSISKGRLTFFLQPSRKRLGQVHIATAVRVSHACPRLRQNVRKVRQVAAFGLLNKDIPVPANRWQGGLQILHCASTVDGRSYVWKPSCCSLVCSGTRVDLTRIAIAAGMGHQSIPHVQTASQAALHPALRCVQPSTSSCWPHCLHALGASAVEI